MTITANNTTHAPKVNKSLSSTPCYKFKTFKNCDHKPIVDSLNATIAKLRRDNSLEHTRHLRAQQQLKLTQLKLKSATDTHERAINNTITHNLLLQRMMKNEFKYKMHKEVFPLQYDKAVLEQKLEEKEDDIEQLKYEMAQLKATNTILRNKLRRYTTKPCSVIVVPNRNQTHMDHAVQSSTDSDKHSNDQDYDELALESNII